MHFSFQVVTFFAEDAETLSRREGLIKFIGNQLDLRTPMTFVKSVFRIMITERYRCELRYPANRNRIKGMRKKHYMLADMEHIFCAIYARYPLARNADWLARAELVHNFHLRRNRYFTKPYNAVSKSHRKLIFLRKWTISLHCSEPTQPLCAPAAPLSIRWRTRTPRTNWTKRS